jgi:hypothetical protein
LPARLPITTEAAPELTSFMISSLKPGERRRGKKKDEEMISAKKIRRRKGDLNWRGAEKSLGFSRKNEAPKIFSALDSYFSWRSELNCFGARSGHFARILDAYVGESILKFDC